MISRIGYRLREFPDGYEARIVREPSGNIAHWILLNPIMWVEKELKKRGWTKVDDRAQNKD